MLVEIESGFGTMRGGSASTSPSPAPQLSESNRPIIDPGGSQLRVYQAWKGNNKFLFGGRLIFGPDARSLVLTVLLILIPEILFSTFVSKRLLHEFPHHIGKLVVAISVFLTAYVIILLLLTSGRDPGIIPRNPHPPEADEDRSCLSMEWSGSQAGSHILPATKDTTINGITVKVKYCQTCMLYRPPRTSHCSICNNCVERFDHHCPWVGQCIGKRNYRCFFMFISTTTLVCLYVFAFCWVDMKLVMNSYHCNLWRAVIKAPVTAILIVYTFVASWFVGGLTTFHLYLLFTNQTTYENFRYRYDGKTNPYNLGFSGNVRQVLLSRVPESRNNFREIVKAGGSSALGYSNRMGCGASPIVGPDMEMGRRQPVVAEDLEDLHSHFESVNGSKRVESGDRLKWEITPDVRVLAAELGLTGTLVKHGGKPV